MWTWGAGNGEERVRQIERAAPARVHFGKTESKWPVAVWHKELNSVLCDNLDGYAVVGAGGVFKREGTYVCL